MAIAAQTSVAGALIADARHRGGLSQRELAARAQTSPAAIAFYERGNRVPTVDTLARIIAACGMELRMEAVLLSEADIAQQRTDIEVGEARAWTNAERFRKSIRTTRPLRTTAS